MKNYKQEMFTKVYRHLLTQRKRAKNGTMCVYRANSGLQCAIGCLISDKKYSNSLEGMGVWENDVKNSLPKRYQKFKDILEILQYVHDTIHPNQWKKQLEFLAKDYGLKIPKL